MPAIGIGGGSWRLLLFVLYRYNAVSGSKHGGFKRRGKGHGRHWPQLAGFGRHWPDDGANSKTTYTFPTLHIPFSYVLFTPLVRNW